MNTELTSVFFDSLDEIKFKQGSNTYLRPEFTQMVGELQKTGYVFYW